EKQIVADRIRQLIEQSRLTQAQVAAKSGLTPAAISHFVTGQRTPGTSAVRRLADALNASVEYILGRDEEPKVSGPTAGVIFRNARELSDDSLELLADFSQTLVEREKKKKQQSEEP